MNTYNSSLDGSCTHDLGWSLGYPLTAQGQDSSLELSFEFRILLLLQYIGRI